MSAADGVPGIAHELPLTETQPVSYAASWRNYRRWYAASLLIFIAFLPTFAFAARHFPSLLRGDGVVITAFFGYAALWIGVTTVARRWKCPRCGECFFLRDVSKPQWPMVFIRSCRACHLPKYATGDPDANIPDAPRIGAQPRDRALES